MKKSLVLFALFAASCATQTPVKRAPTFGELFQHRAGLIIPAEVLGDENSNCRMEFSNTTGRRQAVNFENGKDLYFIDLAPGSYQVTKLACLRASYQVEGNPLWTRFVINDGNLSYFSMLRFSPSNSKVLIQHPDREQTVEMFKQVLKTLQPSDRERLVLAQDGRKLTEKMQEIQKSVFFQYFNTQAIGFEQIKDPVLECQQRELIQNRTLLGKTEYRLLYKNGNLSKMSGGARSTSTYSPQFFECVEKAFTQFHPEAKQEVKLAVTL